MFRFRLRTALAVAVASVAFSAVVADALHRNTPAVVDVTRLASSLAGGAQFAGKSNVLLFHSDGDLVGNGNSVPQIFAFDLGRRVKKQLGGVYQVTFGTRASLHPTGAKRGKILAFDSEADHLGNGSSGRQVFASLAVNWETGFVPLFQVTKGAGESFDPVMSGAGRAIVFTSTHDLTDDGLAPGPHLYRADLRVLGNSGCGGYPCPNVGNPGLSLVSPHEATQPAFDWKSTRVVFVSPEDAAGTGCANGSSQLYLLDVGSGAVQRLTCGVGNSRNPLFTRDDRSVIFESDADLKSNGSHRTQIFQLNLSVQPPFLTQLTFGTDGDSTHPAPNGTRAVNRFFFLSTADLAGTGTAGIERLYELDSTRGLTVVTDGQPIEPPLTAMFQFAAFGSAADLVGNGNSVPHVFLVNGYKNAKPPVAGTPTPAGTPHLERIVLGPATATRSVGDVQRFTATGYRSDGVTMNVTQQVEFASSDPDVASAPNTPGDRSAVTAVAPGIVTISATDPTTGITTTMSGDDATLTVLGPLESITLAPSSSTRNVGQVQNYTVTGHYRGGGTRNLTQQVDYSSSNPQVAVATNTPGNKSYVEAVGSGNATISATDPVTGVTSTASGGDATLHVP